MLWYIRSFIHSLAWLGCRSGCAPQRQRRQLHRQRNWKRSRGGCRRRGRTRTHSGTAATSCGRWGLAIHCTLACCISKFAGQALASQHPAVCNVKGIVAATLSSRQRSCSLEFKTQSGRNRSWSGRSRRWRPSPRRTRQQAVAASRRPCWRPRSSALRSSRWAPAQRLQTAARKFPCFPAHMLCCVR